MSGGARTQLSSTQLLMPKAYCGIVIGGMQGLQLQVAVRSTGSRDGDSKRNFPAKGLAGDWRVRNAGAAASGNSRLTVNANSDAGNNMTISARVESSLPVVADRPMYSNYGGWAPGGHTVTGVVLGR